MLLPTCFLVALAVLQACISATPFAAPCEAEEHCVQDSDAQREQASSDVHALLQVATDVQVRREQAYDYNEAHTRMLVEAARHRLEHKRAQKNQEVQTPTVASFTSADGLLCIEGPVRAAEGSLALKKSCPIGRLYDNVYAVAGTNCADRGYTIGGSEDHCYPGTTLYVRQDSDGEAFGNLEMQEMTMYGQRFNYSLDMAHLMFDCTCHSSSPLVAMRGSQCAELDNVRGAWVHHNPNSSVELMCDEGPYVVATRALAIIKGSAQLPMHLHDPVNAATCAYLGFPQMLPIPDHCFPPMMVAWRTNPSELDVGLQGSMAVESSLFHDGGFESWFSTHNISVNLDVLQSVSGCHCFPGSEVRNSLQLSGIACEEPSNHPPIADWYSGPSSS
mmetsp:Transcript_37588/g.97195  ORF Transcript_37588/g.97195 Transcript_37588/m.97195 type:complete len:389 (+) Transcript_37588:74-1240(+)